MKRIAAALILSIALPAAAQNAAEPAKPAQPAKPAGVQPVERPGLKKKETDKPAVTL
ncbi:MAG: hypothetical protein JNL50_07840, partial [Phycisphaerae bacterium]|nr:hypothetical protein [Phycisphaerae bacterium]